MNNDFQNSLLQLIDLTLQCRPSDPWEFASVFFVDEQTTDYKLAHALHCLPFLVNHDHTRFTDCASTIFCIGLDGTISGTGAQAKIGDVGSEYLRRVVNSLLSNKKHLISALSPHFPTSDFVGFTEFEKVLKLCMASLKYADTLQVLENAFQQQYPDGSVESYIRFLRSRHTALVASQEDPSLESRLLSCIHGAESYRQEHAQDTPLWPKLCANFTVQWFAQQWVDGKV